MNIKKEKHNMTSIYLLSVSIIVLITSFIHCWYSDQLFNTLFIFNLVPSLILSTIWIICLIISIIKIKRYKTKLNISILIVLIINALLIFFFPFREAKVHVEFVLYKNERLEIIQMIKENKLEVDELGNAILPKNYKKISTGGEVFIYQNDENGQNISFWIMRGMMSGSVELVYSSKGEETIEKNQKIDSITSIEKLDDNWYYVVTDY